MEVISSIYNSGYNIKKFYLGSRELNLAYLGNQVIYDEVIGDNDLNYILYEFYGSDTLPNTVEAPVKSAILKGQMLVNLLDMNNLNQQSSITYIAPLTTAKSEITIIATTKTANKSPRVSLYTEGGKWVRNVDTSFTNNKIHYKAESGLYVKELVFTTNNIASDSYSYESLEQFREQGFIVIEGNYKKDVPSYFEGMQPVKMPVLTTTNGSANILIGSQLNDVTGEIETSPYGNKMIEDYILIPNADITMSSAQWLKVFFYDENKVYISNTGGGYIDSYVLNSSTIPTNAKYFRYHYSGSSYPAIRFSDGTDYITPTVGSESFKSNILSASEDVVLWGIGEARDELDLMTGEVVQSVGEIVLDGSDDEEWGLNWGESENYIGFQLTANIPNVKGYSPNQVSNLLPRTEYAALSGKDYEWFVVSHMNTFNLKIAKNKLISSNVDGLKRYLSINPLIAQYQLAEKTIKTVDLTIVDQDGKTINKLNSFNGTTHVSTEVAENSAYPMVSLEVASELQAAMSKVAEDIELIKPVQNDIETTIDTQSNDIDSLLLATTELFEMFL